MTADYLKLNYHIISWSSMQHHHHVSVYILLFCLLFNIFCTFVEWNNQKMFLICSAPPQTVPSLSSDPLMLSLCLTGSDLLSETFQQPTPTTSTDLSQQALCFLFFTFSCLLSSSVVVEHHGFQPLFFQAHLFFRVSVISSHPQAVLSVLASLWLWWLFVIPPRVCPSH